MILDPPIRRNVKLAEAPSFGQTIFDYEPDCAGAQDYKKLAQSVDACTNQGPQPDGDAESQPIDDTKTAPVKEQEPQPLGNE